MKSAKRPNLVFRHAVPTDNPNNLTREVDVFLLMQAVKGG